MTDRITAHLDLLMERYPILLPIRERIAESYDVICTCYEAGGKLIIGGNGGSCADAEMGEAQLIRSILLEN